MDLVEQARIYAEGAKDADMTSAIMQAYSDGYKEGYKNGLAKYHITEVIDGVQYVDLGLPSGTKWSSTYLKNRNSIKYLQYKDAVKLNIPTREQFNELIQCCKIQIEGYYNYRRCRFCGLNSESIILPECQRYMFCNDFVLYYTPFLFWLKDIERKYKDYLGSEALCADGTKDNKIAGKFVYHALPIMLTL